MSLSPMTVFVLQCHSVPTSSSSFASHPDSDTAYTHPHLNSFAILTAWRLASFLSLQRQQQLRKPHWRLSRPLLQWNLGRVENSVAKSQEHSIQQERVNNDICGSGPPSISIFSGHLRVMECDWWLANWFWSRPSTCCRCFSLLSHKAWVPLFLVVSVPLLYFLDPLRLITQMQRHGTHNGILYSLLVELSVDEEWWLAISSHGFSIHVLLLLFLPSIYPYQSANSVC